MEDVSWHAISANEALRKLGSSKENGLSEKEASERVKAFGFNELREEKKRTIYEIFISQFANFLIFVLIAAAVVSAFLGEWLDAMAIGAILLLNALLGTIQEYRAEKAVEMLRKMTAPTALVIRDKKAQSAPARLLVPGDVILLEAGTIVPADCRVIESIMLETNEASLTGESSGVQKDADVVLPVGVQVPKRINMVFAGTSVIKGRGKGVVTATGMNTEFGKIASQVQTVVSEETPLKEEVEKLGKQLAIVVLFACFVIFLFGLLRGLPPVDMFLTSVSLAVAAIPEGLPAVITIALALGVQRMSRRNAIVRKLLAVETLGSANVICTDKTGTITKNEMTVRKLFVAGKSVEVEGTGYSTTGRFLVGTKQIEVESIPSLNRLLRIAALCNNSDLVFAKDGSVSVVGDPTEAALLVLAEKGGVHRDELIDSAKFVREIPFDSERKMMTVVYRFVGDGDVALVKGAPEILLERCSHYIDGGKRKPLTEKARKDILAANSQMAGNALRVLGFAERSFTKLPQSPSEIEKDLTFIGLAGMIDAPREEVPDAIRLCKQAGIEVVMVTGDNEETARAIATEVGLLGPNDIVVTGSALDSMSDEELIKKVERIRVYARVLPEHKLRIVNAWKARGKIVAMTGDGVNDAPALKRADIGIAMGITGTDVTKEVSDVVLADDNFASIVGAIKEGRGIYDNIRKCVAYLLSGNIAEVLVILTTVLLGYPLPLTAIELLWINLITDGLPALALAADPIGSDVMERKPRPRNESFWRGMRLFLFDVPLLFTASALLLFVLYLDFDGLMKAQAVTFTFLIFFEKFVAFGSRSLDHPLGWRVLENRWLILTTLIALLLQIIILYTPFFSGLFKVAPLSLLDWVIILFFSAISYLYIEVVKTSYHKLRQKRAE